MIKKIPNIITIMRIVAIPILVLSFYINNHFAYYIKASIFIFASITDCLDGLFARIWKAESRFGTMLDPIADKLLVICTLFMMVVREIAPIFPTIIILCREIIVSGMRESLGELKAGVSIPIHRLAKFKTMMQMLAITILLLSSHFQVTLNILGNIILWLSSILTIITGYVYFKKILKCII